MTTVRIAGDAGSNGVVKNIASIMQVAAWVQSVSQHGPAEEWQRPGADADAGESANPAL